MASPSPKKAVDMKAPAVRGSRIRRDPPSQVKLVSLAEIRERQARMAVIGIILFALALFVILLGFSNVSGRSMISDKPLEIKVDE